MGVSGAGKSRLGSQLAQTFKTDFFEGDAYHPQSNIEKMRKAIPLCDDDRKPWIKALTEAVTACPSDLVFVSCSSLTRLVQSWLTDQLHCRVVFLHLEVSQDIVRARLERRSGHYMKSNLLHSQFEALKIPETALRIDASRPFEDVHDQAVQIVTDAIAKNVR